MTNKIMLMPIDIGPDELQILEDIMAHISKEERDKIIEESKEEFERAYIYDSVHEEKEDSWKIVIDM